MEEADFFHEIRLVALYASRAVKFAAVVDSKGKEISHSEPLFQVLSYDKNPEL
ncbi:MAG: hypothetical protein WAZ77_20670 [Candidatus Nitrosopolaris sp.]